MVNFDQPLPVYLNSLGFEVKPQCAGNQCMSRIVCCYYYSMVMHCINELLVQ